MFKSNDKTYWSSLELPPQESGPGVQQLLEVCKPSAHGRGNETVYDESYRLACELLQGSFALTEDILNENNNVLASIAALIAPRNPEDGIVARLYKLNAYTVGGFFKAHRDTPKSDRHIGTLVVALPVPFEGGALRVSHEGKHVLFDWGKDINPPGSSSATHDIRLPWAFLFSDVEHEVLPVTSGTRVTLAYDIFTSDKPTLATWPSMDGTTFPLYSDIKAVLENQQFLPGGGRVAVALSHAYPINTRSSLEVFASHLKGADAALYRALLTLRVPISLQAVFSSLHVCEYSDREAEQIFPNDGFGPSYFPSHIQDDVREHELLHTSDKLGEYRGGRYWETDKMEFYKSVCNVKVDVDLICEFAH